MTRVTRAFNLSIRVILSVATEDLSDGKRKESQLACVSRALSLYPERFPAHARNDTLNRNEIRLREDSLSLCYVI